jgi:hypothetical protein
MENSVSMQIRSINMNPSFIRSLMACIFVWLSLSLPAAADVLTIPNVDNPTEPSQNEIDRPSRGMTMDEVTQRYGKPNKVLPPVGDPPITRWIYDNFTVHFERNYVIDSVVHRK